MISVADALQLLVEGVTSTTEVITLPLRDGRNHILAQSVSSPINMPPFNQSAMDGYAVCMESDHYRVIGEIKAGDTDYPQLKVGEAVRIFTGALVPETADAVVMQEQVEREGAIIKIDAPITKQQNIRFEGEQIIKGTVALEKGSKLTPAAIGFLAGLGIKSLKVYQKPSIAIVTTGNELIPPGQPIKKGQIYESNAWMLQAALHSIGFEDTQCFTVSDTLAGTTALLDQVISTHSLTLITGGISVGDHDYVHNALSALSVKEIFYKVRQKPGKPLFFGTKNEASVLALPGNPAAALTCFYIYAWQALERMSGTKNFSHSWLRMTAINPFRKKGDRAQFLRAHYSPKGVEILEAQNSSMLRTFSDANALVFMAENEYEINRGDIVNVLIVPHL